MPRWKTRTSRECQLSSKYLSVIQHNIKNIISLNVKVSVEKCLKYIDIKHVHVYLYTKKIWCKLLLLQGSFKAVTMALSLHVIVKKQQQQKHSLHGTGWAQRFWCTMNKMSGHRSVTTSSFISNNFQKYTMIEHYGTYWHNIIFSLSAVQQCVAHRQSCRALQTQTITSLKRQIPSVEWTYWFPSEYAQSKSLCRHQSNNWLTSFHAMLYLFI